MALALLIAIQAAAATPPAAVDAQIPQVVDFDLARLRGADADADAIPRPGCGTVDPSEILVCGRRPASTYPLEQWARIFALEPIRAEMRIADGLVGGVHVEQAVLDRGQVANRFMIRLRMPF